MNELFDELTNFGEQSSKPCWQKKRKEDFHFLLIQKNSPQHWIVKDGAFCITYWQAVLGIVQFCNIVLSMVSSIGILGIWRSVLKIHFFHWIGPKNDSIQNSIQNKIQNIHSVESRIFNKIIYSQKMRKIIQNSKIRPKYGFWVILRPCIGKH